MRVEVVYALPAAYDATLVELPEGATVRQAIAASAIAVRHPGIELSQLGIFGRRVGADAPLADGDRVEIYRPLRLEPKEARRERARRRAGRQ
jgi:putative ubiquitin-RnfH superfamily antitoxin RatB of RatAB toxin-antitoxin module